MSNDCPTMCLWKMPITQRPRSSSKEWPSCALKNHNLSLALCVRMSRHACHNLRRMHTRTLLFSEHNPAAPSYDYKLTKKKITAYKTTLNAIYARKKGLLNLSYGRTHNRKKKTAAHVHPGIGVQNLLNLRSRRLSASVAAPDWASFAEYCVTVCLYQA